MSLDRNAAQALVRTFYDVLAHGDLSVLDASLAADWVADPPLPTAGPDGWKASVTHLRSALSDIRVSIDRLIVDGDMVAVIGTTTARHAGTMLGVPATGEQITFRSSDMHRIQGDRIVQTWHLEDHLGIATQLGLRLAP